MLDDSKKPRQKSTFFTCISFAVLVFSLFGSAQVVASDGAQNELAKKLSIEGYSPVSYFTKNKAEKGSPEFAVESGEWIYHLTSQEQVALFNQNPDKYKPRYHYCAYSVALGKKLPLDPTNFKVIGDTLLLYHKTEESDGLDLWQKDERSEQDLLRLADKNYTIFEF